jgi:ubiquinone/menaquinone biosynthesis C-methylase UbiE
MTKNIFNQIYETLDEYFFLSESMLKKGFPWTVVLSLHEVHRHLYPIDPYIDNYSIPDTKKPNYILNLLSKQLKLYKTVKVTFTPYENVFSENLNNIYDDVINLSTEDSTHTLYGNLWENFTLKDIVDEPKLLIENRVKTPRFNLHDLKGKTILDLGCGSGRYAIALSTYGCKRVIGFDMGDQGLKVGKSIIEKHKINNVTFIKGNVLDLPFDNDHFDFVFCNGVLHHTKDMEKGIKELYRVLKPGGKSFLYLYAAGGLFWNFRKRVKNIFKKIPREYTQNVLHTIGLPSNRFIFMDNWYVPIERHTTRDELEKILKIGIGFKSVEKLISKNSTDLESYINDDRPFAKELYGDGEHRYLLTK